MKTITGLLIFLAIAVFSQSVIQGIMAKQDFRHCMINYAASVSTDSEIVDAVNKCEIVTGYDVSDTELP